MCGRYAQPFSASQMRQLLVDEGMPVDDALDDDDADAGGGGAPRQTYNFAPGNMGMVYRADTGESGGGGGHEDEQQQQQYGQQQQQQQQQHQHQQRQQGQHEESGGEVVGRDGNVGGGDNISRRQQEQERGQRDEGDGGRESAGTDGSGGGVHAPPAHQPRQQQQEQQEQRDEDGDQEGTGMNESGGGHTTPPQQQPRDQNGGGAGGGEGAETNEPRTTRYKLQAMKWGLVPSWIKRRPDHATVAKAINCREDALAQPTGLWSSIKTHKRCVVPALGFYEWLSRPGSKIKTPHFVKRRDGRPMLFAGLWDCTRCCGGEGEGEGRPLPVYTYTIITTDSNSQLRFLHGRMPAILDPGSAALRAWLDPARTVWSPELQLMLAPFTGELEVYPVSSEVGKVGNDSAMFVVPVSSKENRGNIANFFAKAGKREGRGEERPRDGVKVEEGKDQEEDGKGPTGNLLKGEPDGGSRRGGAGDEEQVKPEVEVGGKNPTAEERQGRGELQDEKIYDEGTKTADQKRPVADVTSQEPEGEKKLGQRLMTKRREKGPMCQGEKKIKMECEAELDKTEAEETEDENRQAETGVKEEEERGEKLAKKRTAKGDETPRIWKDEGVEPESEAEPSDDKGKEDNLDCNALKYASLTGKTVAAVDGERKGNDEVDREPMGEDSGPCPTREMAGRDKKQIRSLPADEEEKEVSRVKRSDQDYHSEGGMISEKPTLSGMSSLEEYEELARQLAAEEARDVKRSAQDDYFEGGIATKKPAVSAMSSLEEDEKLARRLAAEEGKNGTRGVKRPAQEAYPDGSETRSRKVVATSPAAPSPGHTKSRGVISATQNDNSRGKKKKTKDGRGGPARDGNQKITAFFGARSGG